MQKPWSIALAVATALAVAGCASTRLDSTEHFRGELVDSQGLDPRVISTQEVLNVGRGQVLLQQLSRHLIREQHEYQVMQRENYVTERSSPDVGEIILLPFSIICVPFALVLGDPRDCLSSLVDTTYDRYSEVNPVPGKRETEIEEKEGLERIPLEGRRVTLSMNGQQVAKLITGAEGRAGYDMGALLVASRLDPRQLVHGQSLTVTATTDKLRGSARYANDEIPETFFAQRYYKQRDMLIANNQARHGNCNVVAQNQREFYECFYQKGLLPN